MSTVNRVIKNTGFLYAKMGITMFISLYTTRLILNALGASDFGVFNIVGGAIAMMGFLNVAMASATQRFMSYSEGEGDKEKQKKIFNISVILHFTISLLVVLTLLVTGWFLFNGVLNIEVNRIFAAKVVYGSLIISTMFTVMIVPYDAVLNARENMLYYSIVGIIESVLKLVVALAVVYYSIGDKLIMYGVLMAFIPIIVMAIMLIYCHRKYDECVIAPRIYWDKELMKEMTKFAGWNLLGVSSSMITNYGRSIVANFFFGTIVNASLGIVAQLNGQILAFSNNMMKAINPIIIKNEGAGERNNMLQISFIACKLSFLVYAVISLPLFTELSYILRLWLGKPPLYTEIFFKIFIFQVLFEQVSLPLGTVLSAIGKIKEYNLWNTTIMLFSLLIMFVLFKIGFPPYSLMYVSLCSAILLMFVKILYCRRYSDMSIHSYFSQILIPVFFVTSAVLIISYLLKINMQQTFIRFIVICLSTTLTFAILSFYILLSKNEKKYITTFFRKIYEKNKNID